MCTTPKVLYKECGHSTTLDIEPCLRVTVGQEPRCDPLREETHEIPGKCHDCNEIDEIATKQGKSDEEAEEMRRVVEESQKLFEEEQRRVLETQQGHDQELERALQESLNTEQPQLHGDEFDEEELKKITQLSLLSFEDEKTTRTNQPKHFYHIFVKYACGHKRDLGATDIELDPASEGLPYLVEDDYYHNCPDCSGSSSRLADGIAGAVHVEVINPENTFEDDSGSDVDRADVDSVGFGGMGAQPKKGKEPVRSDATPTVTMPPSSDYDSLPNDPDLLPHDLPDMLVDDRASSLRDQEFLRMQRLQHFEPEHQDSEAQADHGEHDSQHDHEGSAYDSGEEYAGSDAPPDLPPYATVNYLPLEGLSGEEREAAERTQRNMVERLRLEGTLAAQDAGEDDVDDDTQGSGQHIHTDSQGAITNRE